jgi:NAD(P)-dependent dehydrogenase (short-subunit alcohol dehydrogenase family)
MADGTAVDGRSVVVTGGANGIGRAICRQLADAGWQVLAVDRDAAALDRLTDGQPGIAGLEADVTRAETAQHAVATAERSGVLWGWVNNAGILDDAPLHDISDATVERVLAVNLRATIFGIRAAVRSFRAHGLPGAIVNVSSIHGQHPFAGHPIYAASKGAVEALTRQICVEYGVDGIRCNAVAPGAVATRMTLTADATDEAAAQQLASAAALSPMGRVSAPEEIADAVVFLLSDRSRSINGHVLAVDNGMSAHGRTPQPARPTKEQQ